MPDDRRHESADLGDYEVLDASDTLDGAPGDDPLDRGVVPPQHWSAAIKYGSTASEQQAGESLDQLLAAEEPEVGTEPEEDAPDLGWDRERDRGGYREARHRRRRGSAGPADAAGRRTGHCRRP